MTYLYIHDLAYLNDTHEWYTRCTPWPYVILLCFNELQVLVVMLDILIYLFAQVMETKNMLYLVSEYAPNGEIFGKCFVIILVFCHHGHQVM